MEIKEFFVLSNFGYSKLGFVARDARSDNLAFEFVPVHVMGTDIYVGACASPETLLECFKLDGNHIKSIQPPTQSRIY